MPTKYEPFAPTVYQPRGECLADYPRDGTYYFAVWAAKDTKPGLYHYTLGLGMAERDVMKTSTTIVSDYMMVKVYMETRWTVLGVTWPVILGLILSQVGLCYQLFAETRTSPTVFQWLTVTAASILFGNVILVLQQVIWAASTASYWGPALLIQLIAYIGIPLASSLTVFFVAYHWHVGNAPEDEEKKCCCCCGLMAPKYYDINRRIVVVLVGLFHLLMVHSGFIVAPLLLIVAGIIPAEKSKNQTQVDAKTDLA